MLDIGISIITGETDGNLIPSPAVPDDPFRSVGADGVDNGQAVMKTHHMRSRTWWDWRLKLYPFIALGLFVYVAARGLWASDPPREVAVKGPVPAAPQTAAFPDRTCWIGWYPTEYFCFVLTLERG